MHYTHYPVNPKGQGLEQVADIYIVKDFDIRATPNPSGVLLSIAKSSDVPEYLRELLRTVLGLPPTET